MLVVQKAQDTHSTIPMPPLGRHYSDRWELLPGEEEADRSKHMSSVELKEPEGFGQELRCVLHPLGVHVDCRCCSLSIVTSRTYVGPTTYSCCAPRRMDGYHGLQSLAMQHHTVRISPRSLRCVCSLLMLQLVHSVCALCWCIHCVTADRELCGWTGRTAADGCLRSSAWDSF